MVAIAITRTELTAAELRAAAARSRDAQAARRMLALALVLEGVDRKTAAETCGMDRQTLRDWVHRYNAEGLAGLSNRRGASRPRRLDPGAGGRAGVLAGGRSRPGDGRGGALAAAGPARPDRGAVRGGAARADGGQVPGGARLPAALGAPAASEGRSRGPGGFQKNFREAVAAAIPEAARGKPLEIWFQDEARVGQQGTLTRVWAQARHPAAGAARHPLRVGLHLRRGLPRARRGRGPGAALRRHRGDERPPRRDRPHRRAGRARGARPRRRRLARRRTRSSCRTTSPSSCSRPTARS